MAEWTDRAVCKLYPMHVFYPDVPHADQKAKGICEGCSVRKECLDFAIDTRQEHGIWGGMNTRERHTFEDNRARKTSPISGTMGATTSGGQRW